MRPNRTNAAPEGTTLAPLTPERSVTAYRNRRLTSALACRGEIRYDTGKRDQRLDRLNGEQTSGPRSKDRAAQSGRADAPEFHSVKGMEAWVPDQSRCDRGRIARLTHDAALGSAGKGHPHRFTHGHGYEAQFSLPGRMGLEVDNSLRLSALELAQ